MARPAPKPGVADPPLVGGTLTEGLQLGIRQPFPSDTDHKDQRAEIILQP
jgi:hypothetical protein